MKRAKLDAKKLNSLVGQIKRIFDSKSYKLSLSILGRRLRVRVNCGNLESYHIAMRISAWLKALDLVPSYLGRVPGRPGAHIIEVRS